MKATIEKNPAEDFLIRILANGPIGCRQVRKLAAEKEIRKSVLRAARLELGVITLPSGSVVKGDFAWKLPEV